MAGTPPRELTLSPQEQILAQDSTPVRVPTPPLVTPAAQATSAGQANEVPVLGQTELGQAAAAGLGRPALEAAHGAGADLVEPLGSQTCKYSGDVLLLLP